MAALAAAAFPLDPIDTKRNYNRDFQKAEVLRYLVRREPLTQMHQPLTISPDLFEVGCEEGYLVFLYHAEEHEYEEGFGPSVNVRIGGDETTWKRSRNKWNPFEKIKTVPGLESSNDFKVVWDRAHSNSFYVTERMYYYLDREKHRDKFRNLRAKLYITRLLQRTGQSFLLQFIIERAQEEEVESYKAVRDSLRPVSRYSNNAGQTQGGPVVPQPRHAAPGHQLPAVQAQSASGSPHNSTDVPSPRTNAMLSAFSKTQLSVPTTLPSTPAAVGSVFNPPYNTSIGAAPSGPIGAALMDHFGAQPFDGSRIQSFPPMSMFAPTARYYPATLVATSSTPQMTLPSNGVLRPLASHPSDSTSLAQLQYAQQAQLQQLFAQQALEYHQQREAILRQQLQQQASIPYASPLSHYAQSYKPSYAHIQSHTKSRSLGEKDSTSWRSESGSMKRLNDTTTSDLPESATKRRSTEVPDQSALPHLFAPGVQLNLAALAADASSYSSSGATTPSTATSTASYSSDRMFES
jgi:hypothetical protein